MYLSHKRQLIDIQKDTGYHETYCMSRKNSISCNSYEKELFVTISAVSYELYQSHVYPGRARVILSFDTFLVSVKEHLRGQVLCKNISIKYILNHQIFT
jgi:hypothetical protein